MMEEFVRSSLPRLAFVSEQSLISEPMPLPVPCSRHWARASA